MEFEALKKVKTTKKICPIHHAPFVQYEEQQPFCLECRKEYLRNAEQKAVDKTFKAYERRRTIEVLKKDSIVGDPKLWQVSFNNYVTDNDETKTALYKARQIAAEYMKVIQTEKRLEKRIAEIKKRIEEKNAESKDKKELENLKKELVEVPKFNTIFSGVPGVGKSHLSMAMLKAINENADPMLSCLFASTNDLLRLIKSSFDNPESKYTELNMTSLLGNVDLLVLDDLGSEASFERYSKKNKEAKNYTQNVLFGILNARQRTIITTNLNSNDLEDVYNAKIISRLYKGVEGHLIKFTKATADKRTKITF
ncbi:ATP-binding protein [Enterococcus hulanensis]|uniref:ATP-binding protein n=1 Tax=Enterococcus hulanensis TaxID=2559929 RepID=A0ABU3EX54_9ENTE|nr:ATP-binding protein [Enterococcus hulanensis]MDT2599454.1 ATP-binding protein [Enterococcus hulanensis]MDT2608861.1 ATP-binding protein [Enterococcus hulanensis]MDT2616616.1 ATP-binding protein [Enterococcus hulanensis]MDT2627344.1 ATP-binding protein [Enterococcus hulanensis]MDT2657210.1 ATP-binding protein [Enterococcus hulanensis]